MDIFLAGLWAITPTLLCGVFFFWVIRLVLRADRTERKVYNRIRDEERAKAGLPPKQ